MIIWSESDRSWLSDYTLCVNITTKQVYINHNYPLTIKDMCCIFLKCHFIVIDSQDEVFPARYSWSASCLSSVLTDLRLWPCFQAEFDSFSSSPATSHQIRYRAVAVFPHLASLLSGLTSPPPSSLLNSSCQNSLERPSHWPGSVTSLWP